MKLLIKNIGPIDRATFTLGDLTIICGGNSAGKTTAAYVVYGFFSFWNDIYSIRIDPKDPYRLIDEGAVELDLQEFIDNASDIIEDACEDFTEELPDVFAASENHFKGSRFRVELEPGDLPSTPMFDSDIGGMGNDLVTITAMADSSVVRFTLREEKKNEQITGLTIERIIRQVVKEMVFGLLLSRPFITSGERTGAAIFRKDVNSARIRAAENLDFQKGNIFGLLASVSKNHSMPVNSDLKIAMRYEESAGTESFIKRKHPDILKDFEAISRGKYVLGERSGRQEFFFIPEGKQTRLLLNESAGSVRSLLSLDYYLRHAALPGNLLIIDMPELCLHPENHRRMARLFARLVNAGIRVLITTHSDYIIKETNTLIMLRHEKPHFKRIVEREGYRKDELLSADQIRVYTAERTMVRDKGAKRKKACNTLVPNDIDPELGIEVGTFDKVIGKMNEIQEEIVWGE